VGLVADGEQRLAGGSGQKLAEAVARNYFRLLACKDEYEVARLLTHEGFIDSLRAQMDGPIRLHFHLAPLISGPIRSRAARKLSSDRLMPLLRPANFRFLRTPLIRSVTALIGGWNGSRSAPMRPDREILPALRPANHALAVQIAALPDEIGFGPVKWPRRLASALPCQRSCSAFMPLPISDSDCSCPVHHTLGPRDGRPWLPALLVAVHAGILPFHDQCMGTGEVPVPGAGRANKAGRSTLAIRARDRGRHALAGVRVAPGRCQRLLAWARHGAASGHAAGEHRWRNVPDRRSCH
jgi:hypothetical protein